ncbi:MAG TPA: hypothetical protein EYN54_13500 [Methylococcaceae bacterium]|nr:hypothetical protein [Methylococcaceae bacterium]
MADLRQNTSKTIRLGPFVDSTDGKTLMVALIINQADMLLSKDGEALTQKNSTGIAVHDALGFYLITFDSTDTNTTGILEFYVNVAGALPYFKTFEVVTESYYDAKHTGTFNNLGGTAQAADHTIALSDMPTVSEFNARTTLTASYATVSLLSTVGADVTAIKAKTDQLLFTVNNQLDSNMITHTATIPVNYITSTGIATNALSGKGDWNIGKTGYSIAGTKNTLDDLKDFDVNAEKVTLDSKTHTGATIPTILTLTGHTPQTGDSFPRIGLNGENLMNISLPDQTLNITGNLSGSVGSVTAEVSASIDKINGKTIIGDGVIVPFGVT